MPTSVSEFSSSHASTTDSVLNAVPASPPHQSSRASHLSRDQDSLQTHRAPHEENIGFCGVIHRMVRSSLNFIKTKIFQFLSYIFPNQMRFFSLKQDTLEIIQNSDIQYEYKLSSFYTFIGACHFAALSSPLDVSIRIEYIKEVFTALPRDLANAIALKNAQLCPTPTDPNDRLEIFISGRENYILSLGKLQESVHFLLHLYPKSILSDKMLIIADEDSSDYEKIEALQILVNFDLNVTFDRFNLQSTETEEEWRNTILDAFNQLAERLQIDLFNKIRPYSHPRNPVIEFRDNPRSDAVKSAIEDLLQELRPIV